MFLILQASKLKHTQKLLSWTELKDILACFCYKGVIKMLTNETTINTLLKYGFSWEEVDYYIRNPEELEKLIIKIEKS